jgi:hypothetical protein
MQFLFQSWHEFQRYICHSIEQSKQGQMSITFGYHHESAYLLIKDFVAFVDVGDISLIFIVPFLAELAPTIGARIEDLISKGQANRWDTYSMLYLAITLSIASSEGLLSA